MDNEGVAGINAGAIPDAAERVTVLTRKRVYILPTRHGVGFFAALTVMLVGAINYNNSLGYSFTFLLGSLALVTMLHTYRNLAGLKIWTSAGPPVFAGEHQMHRVHLSNPDAFAKVDVCVVHSNRDEHGARRDLVTRAQVPARSTAHVPVALRTHRRGWSRLGRITVATRYPLGLFRAWSYVEASRAGLVYPRPAGRPDLPIDVGSEAEGGGRSARGGDDFAGLRQYTPGDSSRRIHWKAIAREQDTAVKVFDGASPIDLRLEWERLTDDPESRLSQLCRWVLEARRLGYKFSLRLPGRYIESGAGDLHTHDCLGALARFGEPDA